MPLQFVPFADHHIPAVEAFNQRMLDGHAAGDFLLPTTPEAQASSPDSPIRWTRYLVLDGEQVRGGVLCMEQPGWMNGRSIRALNFQSPLSEGIVDPKYSIVGVQMVKFMQKQAEAVFLVGMGSLDRPLPKLLAASGWSVRPVPFMFRVHHAGNFVRELRMLRTSPLKRIASQAARVTGLGAMGLAVMQWSRSPGRGTVRQVKEWGAWADDIWRRCRDFCSFAAQRDRRTLESLYPASDPRTIILLIERNAKPVGWSVCFNAALESHRHFGNLRVGSVLDCMADPDSMVLTAALTDREMASRDADFVLVNHSHTAWLRAYRVAGFLNGPSNYLLAMSKKLTEIVHTVPHGDDCVHVTRGDGDGRIHLA